MFDPTALVGFHTWLSLIAIATGIAVVADLIGSRERPGLTAAFLATAVATSATGYLFPFTGVLPSHIVGAVALVVLAAALYALYGRKLGGAARWIYAATAVASLYFLVFVAVAQAFQKIPALQALAPGGGGAVFAVTQIVVLVVFVGLGIAAARAFRPGVGATGTAQRNNRPPALFSRR